MFDLELFVKTDLLFEAWLPPIESIMLFDLPHYAVKRKKVHNFSLKW